MINHGNVGDASAGPFGMITAKPASGITLFVKGAHEIGSEYDRYAGLIRQLEHHFESGPKK
jgi:hypothetical protein